MKNDLKISIITVTYNSESTIKDTIDSVISQTYGNIEYIIIDGDSKDKTLEIVNLYKEKISLIISEPDHGIYDAMNKGIKLATGDVVGIINSDDIFYDDDAITKVASSFSDDIDAVYSDLIYVDRQNTNKKSRIYSSKIFSKNTIPFGIMLAHPTFYVRRNLFNTLGYYKTNYRVAADFELIARFITKGINAKYIPTYLVKMREGGVSSSDMRGRIHQNFEIVRACRENGICTNIFFVMLKIPFKLLSYFKVAK